MKSNQSVQSLKKSEGEAKPKMEEQWLEPVSFYSRVLAATTEPHYSHEKQSVQSLKKSEGEAKPKMEVEWLEIVSFHS